MSARICFVSWIFVSQKFDWGSGKNERADKELTDAWSGGRTNVWTNWSKGGRMNERTKGWTGRMDWRIYEYVDERSNERTDRDERTGGWTDGWTNGRTDERTDRLTDEINWRDKLTYGQGVWTNGRTDGRTFRRADGRMDGRMFRRMVGRTDELVDERSDGRMDARTNVRTNF